MLLHLRTEGNSVSGKSEIYESSLIFEEPSGIEQVQELEGFPDWEGEPSKEWGDSHPTGDSVPTGASKAGQELLDTAFRCDGISSAKALSLDHDEPLLS